MLCGRFRAVSCNERALHQIWIQVLHQHSAGTCTLTNWMQVQAERQCSTWVQSASRAGLSLHLWLEWVQEASRKTITCFGGNGKTRNERNLCVPLPWDRFGRAYFQRHCASLCCRGTKYVPNTSVQHRCKATRNTLQVTPAFSTIVQVRPKFWHYFK